MKNYMLLPINTVLPVITPDAHIRRLQLRTMSKAKEAAIALLEERQEYNKVLITEVILRGSINVD